MSREIRGNHRHLSLDDRIYIEKCLDKSMSFKDIAKFLRKDPTTISKEVKKHRILRKGSFDSSFNKCKHRRHCNLINICHKSAPCNKRCSLCNACNKFCPNFEEDSCSGTRNNRIVCNGCDLKKGCRFSKYYYRAAIAHKSYRSNLIISRQGLNISEDRLLAVDAIVSPLIANGQSIAHIFSTHKADIPFSSRTLYTYIESGYLSVRNIDLPRKVRYKPRQKTKKVYRNPSWRENRTYSDFRAFIEKYPDTNIVEMDTIEGVKGGKVLLTMLFRSSKCMIAFLLKDKTQKAVVSVFNELECKLGTQVFREIFQVILTDNGSEFINPNMLEIGINSSQRTSVYYCDPNASYQKGALEKNHEFIRYFIPKGESLQDYTQQQISLMINHINSLARESLNQRAPFEIASLLLDQKLIKVANLKRIEPDNVIMNKTLFSKS